MSAATGLPNGFDTERYLHTSVTEETIAQVRRVREATLTRGINLSTGLLGYDLHTPAQVVQPVFTPVVNNTPREMGVGIDVHHFKSIVSFGWETLDGGIPGTVDENATPSEPTYNVTQLFNVFQTIGAGNSVSFKAQWRGRQLDGDVLAKRTAELIFILKLIEEQWLIYYSDYLWAPATPLAPTTSQGGAGTIAAATYYVGITAYSANGESTMTKAGSIVVASGGAGNIALTYFTEPLATGYHIYLSSDNVSYFRQPAANFSTPASAEPTQTKPNLFGSASLVLKTSTLSGTAAPTVNGAIVKKGADNNPLTFNGLLAMIFGAGNAVYAGTVNGAPSTAFTAAGGAGTSSNDTTRLGVNTMNPQIMQPAATSGKLAYTDLTYLLNAMFRNSRADPDYMAVSSQDSLTVTNLLVTAGGTRVTINAQVPDALGNLTLGSRVTQMLNPITGKMIQIEVWPFLPQGTLIFGSRSLPFPIPGFDGPIMKVIMNRDYYALDYPPTYATPKYAFADYIDETLQLNFLGGFGVITGIIPG